MSAKAKRAEMLRMWKKVLAHWEEMAQNGLTAKGAPLGGDCAFCEKFMTPYLLSAVHPKCQGCPVMAHTGKNSCGGTPYMAAYKAWTKHSAKFSERAQEMLKFLQELYAKWLADNPPRRRKVAK